MPDTTEILLLGTFHFRDAGLDEHVIGGDQRITSRGVAEGCSGRRVMTVRPIGQRVERPRVNE